MMAGPSASGARMTGRIAGGCLGPKGRWPCQRRWRPGAARWPGCQTAAAVLAGAGANSARKGAAWCTRRSIMIIVTLPIQAAGGLRT